MLLDYPEFAKFVAYLLILMADLIAYSYTLLKIFKVLCFTKITFDQLPLLNPYKWPLSIFRVITKPYFQFWSRLLPSLKLGKVSYDVSTILGLEAISCLISFSVHLRVAAFLEAQNILSSLSS